MLEFIFEIVEKLLVLFENEKGWIKELNCVSFNGVLVKFDLCIWSLDYIKMGKGIILFNEEFKVILDVFCK